MSRHHTTGIDPDNDEAIVDVCYGYDTVPGFKSGYFFQVYSRDPDIIRESPDGEGIIIEEGLLDGIDSNRLTILFHRYKCKLYDLSNDIDLYNALKLP